MNMLEAMRETVLLMDTRLAGRPVVGLDPSLSPRHVYDMLKVMESNDNPQHPGKPFGEGKMGRWLGWAQAAVVAMGCATLDDMKAINKRWSE